MSLTFITNRTLNDVSYAKQNQGDVSFLLGSMNYTDLNRIESNTQVLSENLNEYGYGVQIVERQSAWTVYDVPFLEDINRIRNNVDALQIGFYSLPDWREIVYNNTLDFNQANALEWDLHALGVWLERMVQAFRYCGTFHAAHETLRTHMTADAPPANTWGDVQNGITWGAAAAQDLTWRQAELTARWWET